MNVTTRAVEVPPYRKGPLDLRFKSPHFASREAFLKAFFAEIAENVKREAKHPDKDRWLIPVDVLEGLEEKGAFVLMLSHYSLAELLASSTDRKRVRSSDDYFWVHLQKEDLEDGSPRTGLFTIDFVKREAYFKADKDFIPVRTVSMLEFWNIW